MRAPVLIVRENRSGKFADPDKPPKKSQLRAVNGDFVPILYICILPTNRSGKFQWIHC